VTRPRLRTRLALLHAGLAFAGGTVLLAVVALGAFQGGDNTHQPAPAGNLGEVLEFSAIALVVLAAASIALGRLIAARALRPLRAITRSARSMSANTLDGRLRVPAAYEEFAELADSLDGLAYRLHESFTAQRQFIANASHELRTPLTVLSGFLETLRNLPLDQAEQKRVITLMAQQAERMGHLVADLLVLARLEGSPWPGADRWVGVDALFAHVEAEARALSAGRHVMTFAAAAGAEIAGAESELQSALANLVANAVRYTPDAGRIDVAWQCAASGRGEIAVVDSGPGIARVHLSRLTERFYRVDGGRSRESGGTGLGLAIVKHVMQRHGGELDIESEPGKGSTFRLVLPPFRVRLASAGSSDEGADTATRLTTP